MYTEEQLALIARINALIAERTSYGTRKVLSTKPGVELMWSNAGCCWWAAAMPCEAGAHVLDANQVLIEGISKRRVEEVVAQLDTLPLYKNSFEARYNQ